MARRFTINTGFTLSEKVHADLEFLVNELDSNKSAVVRQAVMEMAKRYRKEISND